MHQRGAQSTGRPKISRRWLRFGICISLAVLTWVVFGQLLQYDFINYDDPRYVYENTNITKGLTIGGIAWAFTHIHSMNWHPLTTISHMLDCQLYGLKPGAHHFTNVLLHSIVAILLLLVLQRMTGGPSGTGSIWRSAFVAAVFAIHPLRVESVAWIAERKDVLSGVFFMLTLLTYFRYVRVRSIGHYLTVLFMFALGLMCKPMLVTLPFVLLVLDYWPLGRIRGQKSDVSGHENLVMLVVEKIPLVGLSAISSVVTFLAQRGAVGWTEQLPVLARINNAVVTYAAYMWQMLWPVKLAVFYPHPESRLPLWEIILCLLLLIGITAAAVVLRKQRPYFITGWLWYLGMLVPVIGIVQVGSQARGDRYTYLPHVGLYLLVTWAMTDLSVSWRHRRAILGIAAATIIIVLAWYASVQTSYWKNSESLWSHTLAVTEGNATARSRYNHDNALAHNNLGNALEQKGLLDEAMFHYRKAVELSPDYADAEYNLGRALFRKGQIDEAIACWQKTLSIHPDDADAHANLGDALLRKGLVRDAAAHYERSLEIAPRSPAILNSLAWVLSTCSDAQLRNG